MYVVNKPEVVLRHRSGNCHYYDSWADFYRYVSRDWVRANVTQETYWVPRPNWLHYENTGDEWYHYQLAMREYDRKWRVETPQGVIYSKDFVLAQAPSYSWRRWNRRRSKRGRRFKWPKIMPTRRHDIELLEMEKEYGMRMGRTRAPYPDPWDDRCVAVQRSWKAHRKTQWK